MWRSVWFLAHYVIGLLVVALMLCGLYAIVRTLRRGRLIASTERRLISVVESTFLGQNTVLHVVKVGARYYLIGGGTSGVALLTEVPAENVEPWLSEQRHLFKAQTQSLAALIEQLRTQKLRR